MPQKLSGKEHGLSGSTLKYIAIITMLIDHFGAAFFIVFTSFYAGTACFAQADILYQVMRGIGRTAFPIFCFVLVEVIRRKPLPPEKEGKVHMIGFALLILLSLLVAYMDVLRLL